MILFKFSKELNFAYFDITKLNTDSDMEHEGEVRAKRKLND